MVGELDPLMRRPLSDRSAKIPRSIDGLPQPQSLGLTTFNLFAGSVTIKFQPSPIITNLP